VKTDLCLRLGYDSSESYPITVFIAIFIFYGTKCVLGDPPCKHEFTLAIKNLLLHFTGIVKLILDLEWTPSCIVSVSHNNSK
jgi:hypothetical protein